MSAAKRVQVQSAKAREHEAVPVLRVAAGGKEKPAALAKVEATAPRSVGQLRPSRVAWERLAAPLRAKKGIRLVVFGITGKGKTTALIEFLAFIKAENLVELTIIHDVKFTERQQYEGAVIHEARDLYTEEHAPQSFPATAVLRKRGLDHMPSVDGAARVTLESADSGVTTMLVVDEFQRGLDEDLGPNGFRKGSTMRIACEGFGLGASFVLSKQLPQFTPSEIRDQSELVIFGMASKGAGLLLADKAIDERAAAVVTGLGVGQFVIVPSEGDFDGQVYQVPAPR